MDEMNNAYPSQPDLPQKTPGMAIASLVLGIVSLVSCCIYYVSGPCAILAIIFGIVTIRKGPAGKGMSIAGIICGGVALLLVVAMLLFAGAIIAATPELEQMLAEYGY